MLHVVELNVPANTPDITPVSTEFTLETGVITQVEVHFPPGCRGFVKTALFRGHYQVFPRPFQTWLSGDAETIRAQLFYEIRGARERFTIYGKSPGSAYPHLITWRINVLPRSVALWWLAVQGFVEALNRFIAVLTGGRR
jgi:hypothetical protein